jgi:hypothetical protein
VAVFLTTWYLFVYRDDAHLRLPRLRAAESRPENP